MGAAQGLHAFKKLREYRKLHELYWEPSPLLSRPYSDNEIEMMKKKLAQRGGNKKETVYDIIKRKKWRMRETEVMDQKANSIADLAAVLLEQEELGMQRAEYIETAAEKDKRKQVLEMLNLARIAETGGQETLESQIKESQATLDEDGAQGRRNKLKKDIHELKRKLAKMRFAIDAVAEARERAKVEESSVPVEPVAVAESTEESSGTGEKRVKKVKKIVVPESVKLAPYLPSYPSAFDRFQIKPENIPKRGELKQEIKRRQQPIFTTNGISIRWANVLDAEFAQAWPNAVKHERMGLVRHAAPAPPESKRALKPAGVCNSDIVEGVAEFKALQWEMRRENWELDPRVKEEVERVRRAKGLIGKEGDVSKLIRLDLSELNASKLSSSGTASDAEAVDQWELDETATSSEPAEPMTSEERKEFLESIKEQVLARVRNKPASRQLSRQYRAALGTVQKIATSKEVKGANQKETFARVERRDRWMRRNMPGYAKA